ncbi:hypothetical protein BO82DRAFT_423578 [Aspergillus uvarum CBS 121591]|uniref:Uncharacterized protein n=1 Tax=Aspergillus uvarum CBS 121591 TaxID=1448315 RepID=A0A319C188_9EURO|nr:hypothetical protein BO82DRAFT_423578 [Aspergillus uvarum CBS 121591]PYH77540.1 hypothetical protein BO82DRAFT_423578 [Aspergillus uvarum CBS 121591]
MPGPKQTKTEDEIPQTDAQFITGKHSSSSHFLTTVAKHSKQVDLNRVAAALGYTNVASTANRFRALRKRYGFELEATQTSGSPTKIDTALAGGNGSLDAQNGQAAPEVTTPTKRKAPAKRNPRKKAKANAEEAAELNTSDEAQAGSDVDAKPNKKGRKKGAAARAKSAPKVEVVVASETPDEVDLANEVV